MKNKIIFCALAIVLLSSCGPDPGTSEDYAATVAEGWTFFETGSYPQAKERFRAAIAIDPAFSEAFTGLAWSQMKTDSLDEAVTVFSFGSATSDVTADLWAGWAFTEHALKQYTASNGRITNALAADANWIFSHTAGLSVSDLRVLTAENHFALGSYAASLSAVQQLNAAFTADVTTTAGQSALAAEIERLKGIN
ncbi:hypothetical protein L6Q79_00575 [bacterium]|nr:hypothetical protein [bacterium]NUN45752.1 hypothetical protein [bacterium]